MTADIQRNFKAFFVDIPLFLPNSVDHMGPNKPWGNGSRASKHFGAGPVVSFSGEKQTMLFPSTRKMEHL